MTDISVERNLIGREDLLLGEGVINQSRGSTIVQVTKINAANFPYDITQTLKQKIDSLDTTHYVDESNIPVYIATPHDNTDLNLVDVIWIKDISSTEKQVYYSDKLMFKYNPTTGNLILDPSLFAASVASITASYQAADTTLSYALQGLLNSEAGFRATDIANVIAAYKAADSALVASLALGTAATKNVGVADGNVVEVLTGGKLPALDGSNLINLPAAALPSGFSLRKLFYSNYTTALITSPDHYIPSSPTTSKGYALFSQSITPTTSGNKISIRVTCPAKAFAGFASNLLAALTVFVNGVYVRGTIERANNSLVVEHLFTTVSVAPLIIDVRVGIFQQGSLTNDYKFYVNDTSFGATGIGANLILEEIKT